MRDLVASRKEEYNSVKSYKVKKRIGREIYDEIVSRGGRFLQQVSNGNEARDVLYEEVPKKRGEEKCKQLLREKLSDKEEEVTESSSEMNMQDAAEEDPNDVSAGDDEIGFELEGIHFPEVLAAAEESSPPISPSLSSLLPSTISEHLSPIGLSPLDRQAETFGEEVQEQAHSLDDDVAVSFLAALGLHPNQPRFSQQDQIQERASLTEEERRSILLDVYGDKSSQITEHQSKRRQSDTDAESVSFLVKQMRTAVDTMHAKKKEALLEALEKASPEEFSDSRLEQFLHSDGGNPEVSVCLDRETALESEIRSSILTCDLFLYE